MTRGNASLRAKRSFVGWAKARSTVPTRNHRAAQRWARFALPTLRNALQGDTAMDTRHDAIDRRQLLGASGAALLMMAEGARTEEGKGPSPPPPAPAGKKLSELIADFVVGFDLKTAPPLAIERTRLAFTDTIGVMLAGS